MVSVRATLGPRLMAHEGPSGERGTLDVLMASVWTP